jgi:hypothetical protein
MATQKQEKGTGAIAAGGGLTAYGAATAPVLRAGSKDKSRMVGASPKMQPARYQAELHHAMRAGKVSAGSTVNVLRTPSGRHINAGGTHRHIARQAMGKPSKYDIKDISHELHVSPLQVAQNKMKVAPLKRGSKRAEAGKKVKPVGNLARGMNQGLAAAADVGDERLWQNPSAIKGPVKFARKAGLVQAGAMAAVGAGMAGVGLRERKEWKKKNGVKKSYNPRMSAFGVEH